MPERRGITKTTHSIPSLRNETIDSSRRSTPVGVTSRQINDIKVNSTMSNSPMCSEEQDQLNTKKVKQLNKKKKKQDTIMSLRDQTEKIMSLHDLRKVI